jgi:hypothetical protein
LKADSIANAGLSAEPGNLAPIFAPAPTISVRFVDIPSARPTYGSRHMKSIFLLMLLLFSAAASAEEVKFKWKGDYAHNSDKPWTRDNPYDSGFSKNFKNGTPQEFGEVKKDGELKGYVYSPKDTKGPAPFVVVMHGCDGMVTSEKEWTQHVADMLNKAGIGALVLDS